MSAIFTITRDQCITGALQVCQAIAKGEPPDATDLSDCSMFLNAMLKFWNIQGYKAWLYMPLSFPSVAGKTSYSIGEAGADVTAPKPLRVPQAWMTDSFNNKTPLNFMELANFSMLTPTFQPGPPNSYHYRPASQTVPTLAAQDGIFYPWPVPTDTSQTFNLICQRPIEDILTGAGTFDIPAEAYLALIWGLAEQVGPIYCTSESQMKRIERNAPRYLEAALDFWEEDGSVFFQPSAQMGR